jgi:hypothetical protein
MRTKERKFKVSFTFDEIQKQHPNYGMIIGAIMISSSLEWCAEESAIEKNK